MSVASSWPRQSILGEGAGSTASCRYWFVFPFQPCQEGKYRTGMVANTEPVAFELSFPETCFHGFFLQFKVPKIMKEWCLWPEGTSSMCCLGAQREGMLTYLRCKSHSGSCRGLCQVEEVMHDTFILCLEQTVEQLFCQIWHVLVLEGNIWLNQGVIQGQMNTYTQGWLRDQKQGASQTESVET